MNIEEVKELIALINDSDIKNFELTLDNATVRISKTDGVMPSAPVQAAPAAAQTASAQTASAPAAPVQTETPAPAPKAEAKGGNIVKAPIVGTFYESAGPGKPVFAPVGSKVKKGDVLCIIEAMKIMNEVVSEFDGEVAEVMVENEQLVEFGQPLFRII